MRILHTSDWHLGHRLYEQSQFYEQEKFLEWLSSFIYEQKIDVLLVSGDIYDTGYPPVQSQDLFFAFLARLYRNTSCKEVVMTAGNHDAPGTLNAPDNFMRNFNIRLIGKAPENIEDEILQFNIDGEKLIVAAVPFLRDRDIRRAVAGEDADQIENRYKKALLNHYNELARHITGSQTDNAFKIAMGHLFALNGKASESENRIYVGGLGDIAANDFPKVFDYVALGHLHKPQTVGGRENIRYPGSPYPLSFEEAKSAKKVIVLETNDSKLQVIREAEVPVFRKLYTLTGTIEYCIKSIVNIADNKEEAEPWVEIILDDPDTTANTYMMINDIAKEKNVKVLKVRRAGLNTLTDITRIEKEDRQLNELKPDDVFRKKCEEENFDLNENKEILDAFYEILNEVENI